MTGGIDHAKVDWDANAPRSIFFDDIYFSGDGVAEARHVFADGNALAERFQTASHFTIGELGFGTGLNMLVAWDMWRRTAKPAGARLELLSFEKFPLASAQFSRAHQAWPQFASLSDRLIASAPPMIEGAYRATLERGVALTLVLGDARDWLSRIDARVDAWFLDGFAPAKNPDLWTPEIFSEIALLSKPGATAATFTVAGGVRSAMQDAGFSIAKRAGFGRKREMLTARLDASPEKSRRAPWFANANLKPLSAGAAIAVIGGGVAGASLAHEIRRSGMIATIIDPDGLAGGASGNPAGLIMPRLDFDDSPPARYFRAAYAQALATIAELERDGGRSFFNPCGVHLRPVDDEDRDRQAKILAARLLPTEFAAALDDGIFFPQAGVIDPVAYCAALIGDAPILHRKAMAISSTDEAAMVSLEGGDRISFDAAIIANGRDALRFVSARSLPLDGVLGQIDVFPDAPAPLHASVFGQYAGPAPGGGVVIGATYRRVGADIAPAATMASTLENIDAVRGALPSLAASLHPDAARSRAGIRCQTPDHLPVAGPAPDWNFYGGAYDDLRLGKLRDYPDGQVAPRLYILTGLGSRGLVTAPYTASMMIAEMIGAPFEREIADALHPARFFIRDLKRSRRIVAK